MQGELEAQHGLSISPMMNRTKPGITSSQHSFIDFVVLPLFEAFVKVFPHCLPLLEGVQKNYARCGVHPSPPTHLSQVSTAV